MRVAVISAAVPFVRGGAEMLEEGLVSEFERHGHEVTHVRIPFRWGTPDEVRSSMAAAAGIRLSPVDRCIALKFPGWLVPHDHKVAWVFHPFRQMYDLWESGIEGNGFEQQDWACLKAQITLEDTRALQACKRVYTYSPTNSDRLLRFNGVHAELLYSPMPLRGRFECGPYGDYLAMIGRVTGGKRTLLAVEALALTETPVGLVIAGVADPSEYGDEIKHRIRELGLERRATYIDRFIDEDEKTVLLANALGSVYVPIDEDNFGYVTGESFLAERPVVTVDDSGGVCWIVEDGVTGLVAGPTPASLAAAFDRLYRDRDEARMLGLVGRERLESMKLDWDHTVRTLLS